MKLLSKIQVPGAPHQTHRVTDRQHFYQSPHVLEKLNILRQGEEAGPGNHRLTLPLVALQTLCWRSEPFLRGAALGPGPHLVPAQKAGVSPPQPGVGQLDAKG